MTRKGTFGVAFAIPEDLDFVISSEVFYINLKRSTENVQLPKYIEIFLNSKIGQLQFDRIKIGAIMGSLSQEAVKSITVILPDISIQENIISIYTVALNNKLESDKQALQIVHSIDSHIASIIGFKFPKIPTKKCFAVKPLTFENRLDPNFYLPNFKALVENIRQIDHAKLGDIITFSNETWNQKDNYENEFPYIEISEIDLASGRIQNISYIPTSEAPSRAKMVVRANDIIVSTTRPHRGAVAYIIPEQNNYIASTGFAVLRNLLKADVLREYLFYILRTQICLQQMLQRSSGGNYPAITTEELKKIVIPIPTIEIQKRIIGEIKTFITKAEELKAEAQKNLEEAKQEIENLILS